MPRKFMKFQHALKPGYFWARNGWGLCPHPKFGLDSPLLALVSLPFLCSLANCCLFHSHKSMEDIKMHVLFVHCK